MFQNNQFIFFDESGEMNFSPKSSKHVVLVGLFVSESPEQILEKYWLLRHDLYINPVDYPSTQRKYMNKRFHASEDPQAVRDKVFALLCKHIDKFVVRSLIIEKANVYDHLQKEEWLYRKMYYFLIKSIFQESNWTKDIKGIQFIIDYNQTKRLTRAIKRGVHSALSTVRNYLPFGLHYSPSGCHPLLQLADYFCWAIYRKYESQQKDLRSYNLIEEAIEDEWKII